jgi:hypothetical protein
MSNAEEVFPTATEMMHAAMARRQITFEDLLDRLMFDGCVSDKRAVELVGIFRNGGRCPADVAVALIHCIADKRLDQ